MPGKKYRSLQNPKAYEAIRRDNPSLSKTAAAKISNAAAAGHKVKRGK